MGESSWVYAVVSWGSWGARQKLQYANALAKFGGDSAEVAQGVAYLDVESIGLLISKGGWIGEWVCNQWVALKVGDNGVECGNHPGQQ